MTPESQTNFGSKGTLNIVKCEYPVLGGHCGRVMRHFVPPDYPSSPIETGKSWLFELKARIEKTPILEYETPKCSRHFPHPSNE